MASLLRRGVRHFVVPQDQLAFARSQVESKGEEVTLLVVKDPVDVLQDLAAHHRGQFDLPVVGITGSNGKTTVKDWLVQLLQTRFKVCFSPRSYNSQIGVPLSVWQLEAEDEVAVFEAGVNAAGQMKNLARIIQPSCGIFTNIGSAHATGFTSRQQKLEEKMSLFTSADWVLIPAESEALYEVAMQLEIPPLLQEGRGRTEVEVGGIALPLELPVLPVIHLENAHAAIAAAFELGLEKSLLTRFSSRLLPLANRLEQKEGLHGAPVIDDSYSNDMDALAAALNFTLSQSSTGKIHLILGTLQGLMPRLRNEGNPEAPLNHALAQLHQLLKGHTETLTLVGKENKWLQQHFPDAAFAESTENLLRDLPRKSWSAHPILVKGASYQHLHRVAEVLSRKQHRTVLRIDLEAIRHNFQVYKSRVSAKMIVMVKASAYGGGLLPVARTLEAAGADYFAVAYADEGKELRRGGITLPIMVLNAEPREFSQLAAFSLMPVVGTREGLELAAQLDLAVHLELDTGMARLGLQPAAFLDTWNALRAQPRIASIFSHLVASENAEHDDFTRQQVERFRNTTETIQAVLGYQPLLHLLNSNGISRWPELAFGAVRLGIGLYGIGDATLAASLRPAISLTTRVAQVKTLPAGASIGYSRKGRLSRESQIATISIGYADGLPRVLGEGRFSVIIKGQSAPIIGAVCMDMTMVDVTDLDEVLVGEEVVIFGAGQQLEVLAEAAGTIPYEILTGIGQRVHRIYLSE